jgi:hypothetical protein
MKGWVIRMMLVHFVWAATKQPFNDKPRHELKLSVALQRDYSELARG